MPKIEIKTLAEKGRELKEKIDRIIKVKGLGLIAVVTVLAKQTASDSSTISDKR
ncbi:hypothetical protein Barb6_01429 [Bacteroidales bacterium Barb6]|nr:hypothetical protein Barb6_01429 [Bacteroidales bacterium Barb6]